jgi:two-component system chemotaxis response regulator CheB
MSAAHGSPGSPAGSGERTVLVVDDSAFMRRVLSDMIGRAPGFRVVGTAGNGVEALRRIERLDPDIVTMDLEMPELDGLRTLERIMAERPRPVVVVSAYTAAGSQAAIEALELGAVDCVAKPSGPISLDMARVEGRLVEALRAAAAADVRALLRRTAVCARRHAARPVAPGAADVAVAIGASTGGPRALAEVLGPLGSDLEAAVFVVQHMPAPFTEPLARRLGQLSGLRVVHVAGGEVPEPGTAYVAPADFHLRVRRDPALRLSLDQEPPVWGVRPSADVLFESVAETYGARAVGVVLTGMGRDGAAGMLRIRRAGGSTLVQDRETAVVYGMPAQCIALGAAEAVVELGRIADAIAERVARIRTRGP